MTEQMKYSGLPVIGNIPNSWQTSRIKYWYDINLGKMLQPLQENSLDTLEPYMCAANIKWSGINLDIVKEMWFSATDKKQYKLKKGDLLVSEGGDVAVSCIWKNQIEECYIQNAIHCVRQRKFSDNRFLYYWLYFLKNYGYIDLICNKATIAHFTKEKLGESPLCVMSFTEQQAIADFLDRECAQIDSIAADLEKQIELLQQYKKSLITETVTKGLDKSVPMKDSGIEWIGKIPQCWQVRRIKYIIQNNADGIKVGPFGSSLTNEVVSSDDGNYKVYGQANLIRKDFEYGDNYVTEQTYKQLRGYEVLPNDITVSMMGTIGKCSVVPEGIKKGIMDSHLIKIRLSDKMIPAYFEYAYESEMGYSQLLFNSKGSIMNGLNSTIVKGIYLPVPPLQEQQNISNYLIKQCNIVNELLNDKQSQLNNILQHKKSLIYEYVTGKKRVKEAQ